MIDEPPLDWMIFMHLIRVNGANWSTADILQALCVAIIVYALLSAATRVGTLSL